MTVTNATSRWDVPQWRPVQYSVGVDIGGTFTDIVLLGDDGSVQTRKVSSTSADYALGIVIGLRQILDEASLQASAVRQVTHGTTVATNAILEHTGAVTGLLTTRGFRDVLEIRRLRHPEMYNLLYQKPPPLVPRRLRREVTERVDARGAVVEPLNEQDVRDEIRRLVEEGVTSIAVCYLNSFANPAHERRTGELIAESAPDVSVSLSCDVLPEIREYERTSTTVINAYVRPLVHRYVDSLLRQLGKVGVSAPLLIMQSNGGILSAATAIQKPVHLVESGPAAGVIAARLLARRIGIANVITFDMGGTTAKGSMIEDGQVHITAEFEVGSQLSQPGWNMAGGGYAMKVPVIDISEVGAGGGSILSVDAGGSLQIGPFSAGAEPGPACYGRGGLAATVTDANVVLGYLNPDHLAGGSVRIDARRSWEALESHVARPLGLSVHEAGWTAHVVANAQMIAAIKAVSTQRGRDPRDFTLLAFGGNGPLHAVGIARLLEMRRIVVPPSPGLFSAFGLLFAERQHFFVQTYYRPFTDLDLTDLNDRLRSLEDQAIAEMLVEGYAREQVRLIRSADLRYTGQGFELPVPLEAAPIDRDSLDRLETLFERAHERTYGHSSPGDPVQFVNLRLTAVALEGLDNDTGGGAKARSEGHRNDTGAKANGRETRPRPTRQAYFGEYGLMPTPVLRRADLSEGPASGPLIVEEYDATTLVPPGWWASLDGIGNIQLEAVSA